ncbi:MAG TPA: OmpA family protein [Sphingomonadales bacterium]
MKRYLKVMAAVTIAAFAVSACTTDPYTGERKAAKTGIGAGVGAAVGAVGGVIIGGSNKRKSALIGAGIGALAGAGVGAYMDAQEAKLRRQLQGTGVSVTRDGNNIILNMPGNITFDTDSPVIRADFDEVLKSVALVLKEYNKTYVDVIGHTDSTGSLAHNQRLSEQRAESVANALVARGVIRERIMTRGMGPNYPIADNATPQGRALNRRVEIALVPIT